MEIKDDVVTEPGLWRYAPDRPLVLVTDYPADASGGGAVILRGLLGTEDRARVVWLSLCQASAGPNASTGGSTLVGAGSSARRADGRRSVWLDSTLLARPIADEIHATARRLNAGALWLVLHGAVVPAAARLMARPDAFPVHATVHDDPVGQMAGSRRYLALAPWYEKTFAAALRRARSVDTICEPMAGRYRQRYGVDSVVVHRGTRGPVLPAPAYDRARGLRVGIIGSVYDYAMVPVLGRAIARAAGRLRVRGAIVIVGKGVGDRLRADMAGAIDVEVTGHLDEFEAVGRLSECFLLYANYPFARRHALFRRTSFPTKISTYARAARPLLIHAPADSSLTPLVAEGPPGYATHWGSLDEGAGADVLARLWNTPACHQSQHEAGEALRSSYYDLDRNRRSLFDALNALVPPTDGSNRT